MLTLIVGVICFYSALKIIARKLSKPKFDDKVVWITGASSGIGQHLAIEFSRRGVKRLILSARNREQLERVKSLCADPSKVQVLPMDMTKFEEVRKATGEVIEELERQNLKLDIVVQNAGVAMMSDFLGFAFENHLSVINVNVHGPYNHIQSLLQHMTKNKSGQIVTISSIWGQVPACNHSSYVTSKYGITGIMDSLRSQLAKDNIKVTTIYPGYIQSNVFKNALASNQGQQLGQNRSFNNAMKTSDFARQAVQTIYNRQNECHISRQWALNPFNALLRGVWPDGFFLYISHKSREMVKPILQKYRP